MALRPNMKRNCYWLHITDRKKRAISMFDVLKILPCGNVQSYGSVLGSELFGHPVFIYSVVRFRSNVPASLNTGHQKHLKRNY